MAKATAKAVAAPIYKSADKAVDSSDDEDMLEAEAESGSEGSESASEEDDVDPNDVIADDGESLSDESSSGEEEEADETQTPKPKKSSKSVTIAETEEEPVRKKRKREPPPPPESFVPCKVRYSSSILDAAQLKGKQLWHITVPADFDMSELEAMSFPANSEVSNLIKLDNDTYKATLSDAPQDESLLMPGSAQEDGYRIANTPISKSLTITHSLKIPEIVAISLATSYVKPVRQQPPNLKMRYVPFGAARGEEEIEAERKLQALRNMSLRDSKPSDDAEMPDEGMEDEDETFKSSPPVMTSPKKIKKHKATNGVTSEPPATPKSKTKTKVTPITPPRLDMDMAATPSTMKSQDTTIAAASILTPKSATIKKKRKTEETEEERRARKTEEKRIRKETETKEERRARKERGKLRKAVLA